MQPYSSSVTALNPETREFYCQSLIHLNHAHVPFLIGGGFAFEQHTGIVRHTKDLDLFIRSQDCSRALDVLSKAGYKTIVAAPHWLAKAVYNDDVVDLIYNSATGYCAVDDQWFEYSVSDRLFDVPVQLCPPEEMIWQKSYVMARDRFDGADVAHLLRACSDSLDWKRLIERFGAHWHVFFSHLILFSFIYPNERSRIPQWVIHEFTQRLQEKQENSETTSKVRGKLCQGTLLAPTEYQVDVEQWGYHDARLQPQGHLTTTELNQWIDHLQHERAEG